MLSLRPFTRLEPPSRRTSNGHSYLPNVGTHTAFVGFEVVAEKLGELPGNGIIGRFVRPGVARNENFLWDVRTFDNDA